MSTGTAVPTLVSTVTTSGDDLVAGAIDEHGFAYYTTGDIPAEVMKVCERGDAASSLFGLDPATSLNGP